MSHEKIPNVWSSCLGPILLILLLLGGVGYYFYRQRPAPPRPPVSQQLLEKYRAIHEPNLMASLDHWPAPGGRVPSRQGRILLLASTATQYPLEMHPQFESLPPSLRATKDGDVGTVIIVNDESVQGGWYQPDGGGPAVPARLVRSHLTVYEARKGRRLGVVTIDGPLESRVPLDSQGRNPPPSLSRLIQSMPQLR